MVISASRFFKVGGDASFDSRPFLLKVIGVESKLFFDCSYEESDSEKSSCVVILANGTFPASDRVKSYFFLCDKLVCCDGAVESALANGRIPDFIVGDCDSIPPELAERFRERIVRITEQDTNDLTKAFRFCVERRWNRLVILGAAGKREDHTLGNISRLADFAEDVDDVRMITDDGVFLAVKNSCAIKTYPRAQVSIFSFDPNQEITSSGLKYPLNRLRLPRWYVATLNEVISDRFSLEFEPSSPLLVYLTRR